MKQTVFIAIVGRPNVGKSTLLNTILGEKVAIVSSKPQTTRNRITGILTKDEKQYVFLDTPGIHKPRTKLGDYMVKSAMGAIGSSDVVILIAEADKPAGDIEKSIIQQIKKTEIPCILALNKIDLTDKEKLASTISHYAELHEFASVIPISALKDKNVEIIFDELEPYLSESEWFFPDDMITDQPEKQIAAEIIREKLLRTLNDEIPHGTAVVIEEFADEESIIKIRAEIFCERESHKRIIIGKNGEALKTVGTYARQDMEKFFGVQVYLNLWVKVKEKWRDNPQNLNNLGFNPKNLK